MLSLIRETQMDKAKKALQEVASYAGEIVRDERLRSDIRAAADHGAKAGDRVKKDVDAGGISSRLVTDRKLRKNLRAMLDDLDKAGERMRRKKSHRVRNILLMLGGAVAAFAAVRFWLWDRTPEGVGSEEDVPLV
jgi:hypothetical protein